MRRSTTFLAAVAVTVFAACSAAHAMMYSVWDKGVWPETWPKELESLRKQARTYEGPMVANRHYLIPFTSREAFEAAWPHLLTVKSKGAPIILVRAPKTDFMKIEPAGVLVHTPPVGSGREARPAEPVPGQSNPRTTWMNTSFIELVVDGDIVDLNRIALPADTPIIDERFQGGADKRVPARNGGQRGKEPQSAPAATAPPPASAGRVADEPKP